MLGLAGISLVSDQNQADAGALVSRKLAETDAGDGIGLFVGQTPIGSLIEVSTANNTYKLVHIEPHIVEISGHPRFCPIPVRVAMQGTRWLDKTLPDCYIAPGMRLQFVEKSGKSVLTSPIRAVTVGR